ncbi:MAG: hypothetical protein IJK06_12295 [Clostridia bacterium]|nr:hypothetical protein [Clostridia bacterium]
MTVASIVINIAIFIITLVLLVRFLRKDGRWDREKVRKTFRFFTCQSNVLCAFAALLTAVSQLAGGIPEWVWILKYIGTSAVSVTMMTVLLFLGPAYSYKELLKGPDFFMHLLTPLLALLSFCVFEKRGMRFSLALTGLLPVVLYGPLYLYKILYAPEGNRWDDFYGFNKSGKWPAAFAAMLAGTFLICMGIMALQNI